MNDSPKLPRLLDMKSLVISSPQESANRLRLSLSFSQALCKIL